MTKEEFSRRITDMTGTLYRVSYGLLRREEDREDAVQEAILRAWEKLPTLRQEAYFQTWVVRILINQCYSIGRKNSRLVSLEEAQRLPDAAPPPETETLRDAVLSLPEELRMPVVLHYIEGYSLSEAADILEVPLGTAKSRLRRARYTLRNILDKEAREV